MDQPLVDTAYGFDVIGTIAGYGVWLRRYIVDEENRDYIKFARVGLAAELHHVAARVPQRHRAHRHQHPSDFLLLLSGSLVIERLYSIPGTAASD